MGVWLRKHLPGTKAGTLWTVGLDGGNGTGFPTPGMVDEQLGLDTEQPVKQLLVVQLFRLPERAASRPFWDSFLA